MRLLIDNLDGQGLVDYSPLVMKDGAVEIARRWNEPSTCTATVWTGGDVALPARRSRVVVLREDDGTLFTGFVEDVLPVEGAAMLRAVSDEVLADAAGARSNWSSTGDAMAGLMQRVADTQGAGLLSAAFVTDSRSVGVVAEGTAATCSENLGAMAKAARCTYSVAGLMVSASHVGAAAHDVTDAGKVEWKQERAGANDICVSGGMEPASYVTEYFAGDGVTSSFELLQAPFHEEQRVLVDDSFADAGLGGWTKHDAGNWMSVGGAGLVLNGGTGVHGVTYLQRPAPVEMGGALLAEVDAVSLSGACDGVLVGLYSGGFDLAHCVAGIRIRQSSGVLIAVVLVNGAESGSAMVVAEGHRYTFRVRLFADVARRVKQVFRVGVAGSEAVFGGGTVASAGRVVVEVQDLGLASSAAATVLCDASVASLPPVAQFVAAESAQMFGSVRRVMLRRESVEVRKRSASGVDTPVLLGERGEGVDASISSTGVLTFFDGRLPDAGEKVVVRYRTRARAIARCEDTAAIATADAAGLPGRVQWQGQMVRPVARSSEDCEQAARALLAVAQDAGSGLAGRCSLVRYGAADDIWPGDTVRDAVGDAIVRSVTVRDAQTWPESASYELRVANEWAEPLSLVAEEDLARDAHSPAVARSSANDPLSDPAELKVIAVTETAIQIEAGMDAPAGGGFEVRRWDAGFGTTVTGLDADLVLRSQVRGFDIPREKQQEMYAVRMYDGSTPRRYSRFSALVRVTSPTA